MSKVDLSKTAEEIVAEMNPAQLEETLAAAKKNDKAVSIRNRRYYYSKGKLRSQQRKKRRRDVFREVKKRAKRETDRQKADQLHTVLTRKE